MQRILLALKQALRKSLLILGITIFLSGLFIFVQSPSYAVQGINEMVKGPEAKNRQESYQSASGLNRMEGVSEEAKKADEADRPLDVQEEQVRKGVVEEGKVLRDLFTGKKPDGTSVFGSDNQ